MRKILFIFTMIFMLPVLSVQAADKAHDEHAAEGPMFVEIDQIVIPIIKSNGKTGVVSLSLVAEVENAEADEQVRNYMPRLKDAYIRALYGDVIARKMTTKEGMLDMVQLKNRLIKTSNYVLKTAAVKDILLDKMAQHTF